MADPVMRGFLDVQTLSSTHPRWDHYQFELECGHLRRMRVDIDKEIPRAIRCRSCEEGKPLDFDVEERKKEIVVRHLYD